VAEATPVVSFRSQLSGQGFEMTAPEPVFAAAAGRLTHAAWCVYLAGQLDEASAHRVHSYVAAAARRPDVDLVIIDLADVTFIDATAIGTLIQAKEDLYQADKALRLAGARGNVAQLLSRTDLIDQVGADHTDLPTIHHEEPWRQASRVPTRLRGDVAPTAHYIDR
jgi:anti-anti-sigma factor